MREGYVCLESLRLNYMVNIKASRILVAGVCCMANLKCNNMQTFTA